jgi:hypothetical protein
MSSRSDGVARRRPVPSFAAATSMVEGYGILSRDLDHVEAHASRPHET